jgi:two-component system NtrC family sensor kinase
MDEQVKILCIDDEKNVLRAIQRLFMDDDYKIYSALSAREGLEILGGIDEVQIVISDYRMPGMNGIEFLREVCRKWPDTVRIVLSGFADTAAVVEAINDGQIYKFIPKPWDDDELRSTIQKGIEAYFQKKQNLQLLTELKTSNEKLRKTNQNLEIARQTILQETFPQQVQNIYHNIISSLPMGIIGIDSDGCVAIYNDAAIKLLGGPRKQILGRPWSVALPQMFGPFLQKLIAQGELSDNCLIGGRKGWIKGNRIHLDHLDGLLLAFDLEEGDHG